MSTMKEIPKGFRLRHSLKGHRGIVSRVTWSPDGRQLATPSRDGTVRIWDPVSGETIMTLRDPAQDTIWYSSVAWGPDQSQLAASTGDGIVRIWVLSDQRLDFGLIGHTGPVHSIEWHPDGNKIATGSSDRTMRLWDDETRELLWTRTDHSGHVYKVAWSPDGTMLASGSADTTIRLWGAQVGLPMRILEGHSDAVYDICWAKDNKCLISASADSTIRVWNPNNGRQIAILEGHSEAVVSVSLSADGELLASKSQDGSIIFWLTSTWQRIATIEESTFLDGFSNAAFHPRLAVLASQSDLEMTVRLLELDIPYLIDQEQEADTVHYTNAKVVLVGDTGVGKTGLGLVLTGRAFEPTESTHGRHVWTMDNNTVTLEDGREETRETLLWDLAGQPGYRMVHQLHLNEVAIALVLFDSRSDVDPFGGVRHWARALKQAQRISSTGEHMRKFLVAARVDRGGIGVSQARIEDALDRFDFDGFYETSAKEGWDIPELQKAIVAGIDWSQLPKVSSTVLFTRIKDFLITEKEAGTELMTFDELYRVFEKKHGRSVRLMNVMDEDDAKKMLRQQFETCIGRVESRGLIRRLSFGNLILLQPELLDAYASSIVNFVKNSPDGMGNVYEEDLRNGRFRMAQDERIQDRNKEKLLLIATVEDLLRHEIALREQSSSGEVLVFPSEFTKERSKAPDPEGKAVVYSFEGPILNIYATLIVRLLRSGVFIKDEIWHNLVTFKDKDAAICGILLQEIEDGKGEMTLFFEDAAADSQEQFEEYIRLHLQRRALPDTIYRRQIFRCTNCGFVVTEQIIRLRKEQQGLDWIHCPVCTVVVSLTEKVEKIDEAPTEVIVKIDEAAEKERDLDLAVSIFQGKIATRDYDVALCYTPVDRDIVLKVNERLREQGILPWLVNWKDQKEVQDLPIVQIKAAAFFYNNKKIGPGKTNELVHFLQQLHAAGCPVLPVVADKTSRQIPQPIQITDHRWINLWYSKQNPITQIIQGVTGGRGKTSHRQPSMWISSPANGDQSPQVVELGALADVIAQTYSMDQIKTLYQKLRIRRENGNTGSLNPAEEIVTYCDRRGYIHTLILHCRQLDKSFPY